MDRFQRLVLFFAVLLFISGCGGSSTSDSALPPSSGSDTSAIAGFWNVSEENDNDELDILYALISTDGLITEYDYDRDAAGSGRDCYLLSTSTLVALGNNEYRQSDEIEGGFDTFTAVRQGAVLTVSFIDVDDGNQNGSTTDVITETYDELTGVDPATLADCDQNTDSPTIPVTDSNGLVVGGFDESRGGINAIDIGAFKNSLENHIDGVSIVTTPVLSESFLDQIDVLAVDVVFSSGAAITPLNLSEVAALESFVNRGGGLLVASDNPSFQTASNSFLAPFGLTAGGIASGGLHTASVIDRTTYSDITDGPFGQVVTVSANNTGSFTSLGQFTVLANWNSGPLTDNPAVVARADIGDGGGRIVSVADHQTVIAGLEDSEILFLNSIYFLSKGLTAGIVTNDDPNGVNQNATVDMFSVTSNSSDTNPDTLVRVDVDSAQQSILNATGGVAVGTNIDWNPVTQKFYGTDVFDFPGSVHEIDAVAGTSVEIAQVRDAAGDVLEIGAIAFAADGVLYAAEGRNTRTGLRIGIVDLQSETFSEIMSVPTDVFVPGMDIGMDGMLYAVYSLFQTGANTSNRLVTIDPQSRQVVDELVLESDFAIGDVDLAANGYLYHSNFSYALIRVNLDSGLAENIGFGEVGAMAGLGSVQ